jgi:hypothetical protein
VFFGIDKLPWPLGFGVLRSALIVTIETGGKILSRADVVRSIVFRMDYVDEVGHKQEKHVTPLKRR